MKKNAITILIVEDHKVTRLGLKMVLEDRPGFVVVGEVDNGTIALKQISALAPDVVLLDIGLPQIDGIECLKRVKAKGLSSRIMMRSSHEEHSAILAALAAGADGYCLKDSSDDLLVQGIECLARGQAWLDPRIAGHLISHFTKRTNARLSSGTKQSAGAALLMKEVALLNEIAGQSPLKPTFRLSHNDPAPDQLRALMTKMGQMYGQSPK